MRNKLLLFVQCGTHLSVVVMHIQDNKLKEKEMVILLHSDRGFSPSTVGCVGFRG